MGILPGTATPATPTPTSIPLATGMGEARNVLVARSADALIAIGGEWGTLSEVAMARKVEVPVVLLRPGITAALDLPVAPSAEDAVAPRPEGRLPMRRPRDRLHRPARPRRRVPHRTRRLRPAAPHPAAPMPDADRWVAEDKLQHFALSFAATDGVRRRPHGAGAAARPRRGGGAGPLAGHGKEIADVRRGGSVQPQGPGVGRRRRRAGLHIRATRIH
jgi:hypothetical protein